MRSVNNVKKGSHSVVAAHRAGWHAVLHESTPGSIAELEQIMDGEGS